MKKVHLACLFLVLGYSVYSQSSDEIIQKIKEEVFTNSEKHLQENAHELLDDIGPRLVGTPKMNEAHDWAVKKFESYGLQAENQQWGTWKSWERGITHIDMIHPWIKTLAGTQLAWSPSTSKKGIKAEVITFPEEIKDKADFENWLSTIKGKLILVSMPQPTGRPDYDWEKWATKVSFAKMKEERETQKKAWEDNLKKSGYVTSVGLRGMKRLITALEEAGAAGIISNYWSNGFGTDKIFWADTEKIPTVNIELEDYTMLYRMVRHGDKPQLHLVAQSKDLGEAPTFNTIAEIKGIEKPEEYVILSAHFDSWDGGSGATDNGTGTLLMLEVARILKEFYPNPKRTILIGLWGSEEQGLNGSAAFVADHPNIIENTQVVFNQDSGTGRIKDIGGSGFLHAYNYLSRWMEAVPDTVNKVTFDFPGTPATSGSDHASFIRAGVPAFRLGSLGWNYGPYTWHTNRDTYDKIIWDDVKNNVLLTAILTYMASEDEERVSNEKIILPIDKNTGEPQKWATPSTPDRKGW